MKGGSMKRYDLEYIARGSEGYNALVEVTEGTWVLYEDVEALADKVLHLRSALGRIQAICNTDTNSEACREVAKYIDTLLGYVK
jgi:hypothetical protein